MTTPPRPSEASPTSSRGDLDEFRAGVREWCRAHIPAGWRQAQVGASDEEFVSFQKAWFAELRRAGFAVPHWPKEWGGGMSAPEQVGLYSELAAHDAPRLVLAFVAIPPAAAPLPPPGAPRQRGHAARRARERGLGGGAADAGYRARHDHARAGGAARSRRPKVARGSVRPAGARWGASARRLAGGRPAGGVRDRGRRPPRALPQTRGTPRRRHRRPGRRLDREAVLQRVAAADDGLRHRGRRPGRPYRAPQARLERVGVRRLGPRLHPLLAAAHPRRYPQ